MAAIEEDDVPGVPEWVVTYGDMMSLLLTFFIMLVSMSELKDEGKIRAMLDAIRQSFGPTAGVAGVPGRSPLSNSINAGLKSSGMRSEGGTKKSSRDAAGQAGANRTVQRLSHGTVVTLGGPALFKRTDTSLSAELKRNLDVICNLLADRPNRLMIRGHTSAEPLPDDETLEFEGLSIRNHWDLSFARARAVAAYLAQRGVAWERMLVSAAGDTEPRTLAAGRDAQQHNHRVDVFVLDAYIQHPEETDSANR